MEYGTTNGVLKPLNEALLPDVRFQWMAIETPNETRPFQLTDLHERLMLSKIESSVPEKVRRQFETAKNLMLYSWFVFEFHTIAELHAYATLELALRTRFPDAKKEQTLKGQKVMMPFSLRRLLDLAVKQKVIVAETLPAWERVKFNRKWYQERFNLPESPMQTSDEWLQKLLEIIPNFRNSLAHGEPRLYLEASFKQLELCCDLINQIFPSVKA